eukprot:GILK01016523.1.p2 GENE.GILK01016523.1~~GILK01016523.1.p2  ORF type:complete len:110 (+),score=1.75 GILK01016523.1:142-471(+)
MKSATTYNNNTTLYCELVATRRLALESYFLSAVLWSVHVSATWGNPTTSTFLWVHFTIEVRVNLHQRSVASLIWESIILHCAYWPLTNTELNVTHKLTWHSFARAQETM